MYPLYKIFSVFFTPKHGYKVVPYVDWSFFAELTHAEFHKKDRDCSQYENREVGNDKRT